jgi:hypothetical protein
MANIIDILFMKPSVDDTQADRMRIPAAANAMGKVVHNMEEAMDEEEGDELEFIAAAHALIVDAALAAMEEDDASDSEMEEAQEEADVSMLYLQWLRVSHLTASDAAWEDYQLHQVAHTLSFDKAMRAPFVQAGPRRLDEWNQLSADEFKHRTGGWDPAGFLAMIALLILMPDPVQTDCGVFSLAFCVYCLHRRWVAPISYRMLQSELNVESTILNRICNTCLDLLTVAYIDVIEVLDVLRLLPLVDEWNELLTTDFRATGGRARIGSEYAVGAVDGSARFTGAPGQGEVCY